MPSRPPVFVPPGSRSRQEANRERMQRDVRIRGKAGVQRRRMFLDIHPLCVMCTAIGRVTAATIVDHVVPISQGGSDGDPANWQSLCAAHSSEKTAAERKR